MSNRGVGIRLFVDGAQEVKRDFNQVADSGKRMWAEMGAGQRSANPALRALSAGVSEAKEGVVGLADQAGGLGSALSALGPAGVLAAATATGIGIAFTQARKAMDFGAEIADAAAKIGISTDALQEYRYAISQTGGEAEDADAAIGAFTRTLGAAVSGLSPKAMKGFSALGFSKDDLANFKSADDALQAVTTRIAEVSTEAERAAIAEKLGLTPMLPLLREGADNLNQLRQNAHEFGLVWDADVIAGMDDAADKFDTASKIINSQFKQAFVDLVPVLVEVMKKVADLARETNAFLEGFKKIEDRNSQALSERKADALREMVRLGMSPTLKISKAEQRQYDAVVAEYNRLDFELRKRWSTQEDPKLKPEAPVVDPKGGKGSSSNRIEVTPYDTVSGYDPVTGEALRPKSATDWWHEEKFGPRELDSPQVKVVTSVDLSTALSQATAQFDELRDSTRDAFASGIEAVLNGGDIWDILKFRLREAAVDGLANVLTNLWSDATGGGMKSGGFWGTVASGAKWLFGRHAAGTGMTQAPIGLSQGEFGPELALFGRNGQVINHEDTVRLLQQAAGQGQQSAVPSVAFTYAPVIHAQGAGPREIDLLRAQIAQQQRELPALVIQTVNDASQRRLIVRD